MAAASFRSPMTGPGFPLLNANISSSASTGWNEVAALPATGSASASSLPLPASMGLVSRWSITRRASNAGSGFRCPRVLVWIPPSRQAKTASRCRREAVLCCEPCGPRSGGSGGEIAEFDHVLFLLLVARRQLEQARRGAAEDVVLALLRDERQVV